MPTFKCKMCGGTLEIKDNASIATCEYCGTTQTLPKIDDERKANLYDRANHFRRNNEFDKAMGIYEQILNEDNTDAEAYWSLVLCRYGIEYVEDPSSHKRIPTVNRAQFTSVFDDDNYKTALQYADGYQKSIYEQEANTINEIQKGILAISQKEEPFDVFICYKESDNNGRRTQDSVLANDLYHQLTQEGFKVFFARITLEDKLGSAYEPYIFAALNSAKVMVVLGTKPEYFNAVWVKNEWARYLSLIKNGAQKMLIPAYKDMDPYDLPEEFSHLQAQDMSKLGFMQDLIRGIKKIAKTDEPKTTTVVRETVVTGGNANTAQLLKRVFMFLEDKDWNSADEYCEKVLDIEPECAEAYLGKLMVELHVRSRQNLKNCSTPFNNKNNFQKAMRFADDALKNELRSYNDYIESRNTENAYRGATSAMKSADTEDDYLKAAASFEKISNYKDSKEKAKECREKAEEVRKDLILTHGNRKMVGDSIYNYQIAIKLFESISGWKDADEKICACQKKIEEIIAAEEKLMKQIKKIAAIVTSIICVAIVIGIILNNVIIPNVKYNKAVELMENEKYVEAYEYLIALDGYKDSEEKASSIYSKYKVEELKVAEVGDYVFFGAYEQDNNTSNGKEDIEWLVLEVTDSKVLLISKYALDCKRYNTSYSDVTWETCSLREWLNGDFINTAFAEYEKAMIPTVTVTADANPEYDTSAGSDTQDKVFLLSIVQAYQYFDSSDTRQCKPTDYAVANGAYVNSDNGNCWWWLRSPGIYQYRAAIVDYDGDVGELGSGVDGGSRAVRPALWIDLNS